MEIRNNPFAPDKEFFYDDSGVGPVKYPIANIIDGAAASDIIGVNIVSGQLKSTDGYTGPVLTASSFGGTVVVENGYMVVTIFPLNATAWDYFQTRMSDLSNAINNLRGEFILTFDFGGKTSEEFTLRTDYKDCLLSPFQP